MLQIILDSVKSQLPPEVNPQVAHEVNKMLLILNDEMSRKDILIKLGLKDEKHFRQAYLHPAIDAKLIEMTIPDKPNSRLQKYRITAKGISFVKMC